MEWNKIYQGDNLELAKRLEKEGLSFNLMIADPPYNIGKDFGNKTDKQDPKDYIDGFKERLSVFDNVLTPNANIIVFCSQIYIGDIQLALREIFYQRHLNIWYFENGMSRQKHEPVSEFDPFWWFSKSPDKWTYNVEDIRIPYKSDRVRNPVYKRNAKGDKVAWTPDPRGRKHGDVWGHPVLSGKKFEGERTKHPSQKPESLIEEIIRGFCPKDADDRYVGRILDPYMGSGTTAVCCEKLNRNLGHQIKWIGLELEQEWIDLANDRIDRERNKPIETDIFG